MPFTGKEKAFCVLEKARTRVYLRLNLLKCTSINKTCCSVFGRRWFTDLTYDVSRAMRRLKTCEIVQEIHIYLNFSSKFGRIDLILLDVKPVSFHLPRLYSYSDIYVLNDNTFVFRTRSTSLKHSTTKLHTVRIGIGQV